MKTNTEALQSARSQTRIPIPPMTPHFSHGVLFFQGDGFSGAPTAKPVSDEKCALCARKRVVGVDVAVEQT